MASVKVAIIFPTFNGWADTKECLNSLSKLDYPKKQLAVIVIDNNSHDKTADNINKFFPWAKVIPQRENLGYSKAVNIGVKNSESEYVLFSNNDIELDKNYLNSMVKLAKSDKKIGIIGGMVYLKEPKGKLGFNGLRINPYLGYHQYFLENLDQVQECDIPPAGGFFVRKKMLDKIGLLNEAFFLYFEDIDLCLRAKKAGYKVIFNPKAVAYHGHAKTTMRANFYDIVFTGYKSKWICLLKNANFLQIGTSLISELIILLISNIKTKPKTYKPILAAIFWSFKNLKFIRSSMPIEIHNEN